MHLSRLFLLALSCLPFLGCDPATDPAPENGNPAAGFRWEAKPVGDPNTDLYKITLEFPREDSLVILTWRRDASTDPWRINDTTCLARIVQRNGVRWNLSNMRGRMATRNPSGWMRVEDHAGKLAVLVNSFRITPQQADLQTLVGTWTMNDNYKVLPGTVTLKADSTWHDAALANPETGRWYLTNLTLSELQKYPLDPDVVSYLAGRECLSAFSSAYLVERSNGGVWLDQYGDQALAMFHKIP